MPPIPAILSQHAEEAAFLWQLRDAAVRAPHYTLADLSRLDGRVEAHLDGLVVAGDAGWEICLGGLARGEGGEAFAAAVLAFQGGSDHRFRELLEIGSATPERSRGLISALGWLPLERAKEPIRRLLLEESPTPRRLGIAAAAIHRQPLRWPLARALKDEDAPLRARAIRAVGELGLGNYLDAVRESLNHEDRRCRFAAAWTHALLAEEPRAADHLRAFATPGGMLGERAVLVAMRRMKPVDARTWWESLAGDPERVRLAVLGSGAIGDPEAIPWLIEQMQVPSLARVAGESFATITGVDLASEGLEGQWPEGFEAGPTEDPADEDVAMDPDENLPWPDPGAVQTWWDRNRPRFSPGSRYLLGQPIDLDGLHRVLKEGRQRQRTAATIELAVRQPGRPLHEVRAPGFRQLQSTRIPTTSPERPATKPTQDRAPTGRTHSRYGQWSSWDQ
jgi:uncharacterized protein (TIGR02270 family)